MSKKTRRNETEPRRSLLDSRTFTLLGGGLFVALFIALGIVLVSQLGWDDWSKDDPKIPDLPALGAVPAAERSSAAELLDTTSFEDMTEAERTLFAAEAARALSDGEFRVDNSGVVGLDIVRRGGHTVATRQYNYSDTPGEAISVVSTIVFYCPGPTPESIDLYRAVVTPFKTEVAYDRKAQGTQPFERVFEVDWSQGRDLGYKEIEGRRAHGVELPFLGAGSALRVEHWYDVENARLLSWWDTSGGASLAYILDWRRPEPITPPVELQKPPCADAIYPA